MESNARFFRRRANEELAAADRAVTEAARLRRVHLAGAFLERLKAHESELVLSEPESRAVANGNAGRPVFGWSEQGSVQHV